MLAFNKITALALSLLTLLSAPAIYSMEIFEAARTGNVNRILELIAYGADVNQQNNHGSTPLHNAAYHGHQIVVQTLIASGANVNQQDNYGWTALHHATDCCHQAIVQTLVTSGANVNQPDIYGWTPLHDAAYCGNRASVQTLIAAGAHINQQDNKGNTPLDAATTRGYQEIVNLINRVNDAQALANRQLLALLGARNARLCTCTSARCVFEDTQPNGLAHMIGRIVRQAALEDALSQHNQ